MGQSPVSVGVLPPPDASLRSPDHNPVDLLQVRGKGLGTSADEIDLLVTIWAPLISLCWKFSRTFASAAGKLAQSVPLLRGRHLQTSR